MNALVLKDLLNLRNSMKTIVIMMIIFGIIFIPTGNVITLYFLLMIFGAMLPSTSISYDDMAKWDKFALTMPLKKKDIVRSKFILMIVLTVISLAIAVLATAIIYAFNPSLLTSVNINPLSMLAVIFALGPLYGSLALPILYKFGSEKARYVMIFIMVLAGAAVLGIFMIFGNIIGSVNPIAATVLPLAVSLVIMFISYKLSCRIYEKKEF